MKIARVTGSLTATIKNDQLSGMTMLVTDIVDTTDQVLEPAVVVVDHLGAGRGDLVLLVTGSAARIPSQVAGIAVDAVTVAIVDEIDSGAARRVAPTAGKSTRRVSRK